jgi:hypothetical protein
VEVTSFDDEGGPRNFYRTVMRLISPDLEPTEAVLEQVGPGRYAGTVHAEDAGAYLVRVAQTLESPEGTDSASRTLGIVSPTADEFRRLGIDTDALAAYAAAGNGRRLPLDAEEPGAEVWRHDIAAGAFPTPIWPWLLILAIVLVPLDVGVRRVALTRAHFRRARGWAGRRIGIGRPEPEAVPGLAELRAAKARSDRRTVRGTDPAAETATPGVAVASAPPATPRPTSRRRPAPPAKVEPAPTAQTPPDQGETLAERLARRRRSG